MPRPQATAPSCTRLLRALRRQERGNRSRQRRMRISHLLILLFLRRMPSGLFLIPFQICRILVRPIKTTAYSYTIILNTFYKINWEEVYCYTSNWLFLVGYHSHEIVLFGF